MLANLVLLLITLLVLYFVGLLWLRQNLLSELRELQHRQDVLMKDFEKRRDQVPVLLESIREQQEPSDAWRKLVADRAATQNLHTLEAEENFNRQLDDFIAGTSLRSVNFLQAKQDLEATAQLIEKQKSEIHTASAAYNAKRKQFPYTLASGIFGFREISA